MPDFDNLKNEFDLPIEESKDIEIVKPKEIERSSSHLDDDYSQIRNNLKDIIKRGTEAIDGILLVASETNQPRAYEVVATLIKSVADVNKDLLTMHKQMQDIKGDQPKNPTTSNVTNNSIFVGSTTELQALLKGRMDQLKQLD